MGDAVGDGEGVGDAVGDGEAVGVGDALGVGDAEGVGDGDGFGLSSDETLAEASERRYNVRASKSLAERCEVLPCVSLMT